jgi:hypothetical protein
MMLAAEPQSSHRYCQQLLAALARIAKMAAFNESGSPGHASMILAKSGRISIVVWRFE